jgi:hypothetical protein
VCGVRDGGVGISEVDLTALAQIWLHLLLLMYLGFIFYILYVRSETTVGCCYWYRFDALYLQAAVAFLDNSSDHG